MRKFIFLTVGISMLFLGGCVESSQKYKDLQARVDSLNNANAAQGGELEEMFAGLNDISAGMQSLREAENLLAMESSENAPGSRSKQQIERLKVDIAAITEAINTYKEQISKLEGKNKRQSAEFRKLIDGLNAELELRSQKIEEITRQLAEKNAELAVKGQQIEKLSENVETLNKETAGQKVVISEQDQALNKANYLVGTRKDLKEANVISRKGLFCPPIVSSQAQNANFTGVDIRELSNLPLNSKKAKVLSIHPADSYVLETAEDGNLVLKITDVNSFWKQTKYLVVMTD